MTAYHFEKILFNEGVQSNVLIRVDNNGMILAIEKDAEKQGEIQIVKGLTLPGFQNAHSHAFQYAMAGLAEVHDPTKRSDSFWTWRNAMYDLALSIDPDDLEAIAGMLYAEMLSAGYTNVAEFHYVHHNKDGKPYASISEMGSRLIAAAKKTGINITLVPIFYQKGGFGVPAVEGQKRFLSANMEDYLKLLESSKLDCLHYEGANVGIGIHSMRGVDPEEIKRTSLAGPQDIPFHIHISEQLKEVQDSLAYLRQRPVEWFAHNIAMNDRYHLVHATHLTPEEVKAISSSGANVVICPTTEGNLGDGLFPLHDYQQQNGQWSIGTDSHVSLDPLEELRLLDYGQRLTTHSRMTFAHTSGDSGAFAIEQALLSGRKAMNDYTTDFFAIGSPLNAATYDTSTPLLAASEDAKLISTLVYSCSSKHAKQTISRGVVVSRDGTHISQNEISDQFVQTLKKLGNRL
ncbi:MAG: formimidoylglutamate deiminase [Bacteroidetes bacterium]|nr:MAG: formimidoylglutamate deiminase [Bacteroidota bacterium]